MPQRKLQIFVSSTFLDLRRERQAAVSAILENGHIPAGMELFAAGNEEQMGVIRRWIDESDIFLLILGGRYGTVEPVSGKSYIQLEYEHAVNKEKPHFTIVMTDESRDARIKAGESVAVLHESVSPQKLIDFRNVVTRKLCKFANDEKDIRLGIWQSIRDLEQRTEFAGWVSARELPDMSQILSDVAASAKQSVELETKNRTLSDRIAQLQADLNRRRDFGGRTFEELALALRQQTVSINRPERDAVKMDLLTALNATASSLATGVSNAYGSSDYEGELFHKVANAVFVYGLTEHAKVPPGVAWSRFVLSDVGQRFLTELRIRLAQEGAKTHKASSSKQVDKDIPTAPESAREDVHLQKAKPQRRRGARKGV